ncbi:MAG: DNA mismatch repair protein MutS [Muribaculaceae bacterium]|nr:DNA mismatch repair protein MutS [Muribaculaceae bacterium]
MAKDVVKTPLMKQYFEMKRKHPDAVLLFRVGDFYETFCDDAITASQILGITLTRRANGSAQSVELAGFPHHALDTYLPKLVRAGKRVAICEQLEDPKTVKGLVKRGITELITPGVTMNDNVLDHRENNFLAALHQSKDTWGLALLDISTGEFLVAEGNVDYIDKLLNSFAPKEVLVVRGQRTLVEATMTAKFVVSEMDDWVFTPDSANQRLLRHFETASLKGFGVEKMLLAIVAAGAILQYLDITKHTRLAHITRLQRVEESTSVRLDRFTVRNLELLESIGEGGRSLLSVIDRTVTPMGARLLHRWLMFPLKDPVAINSRLDTVEYFFRQPDMADVILDSLKRIGDLERLVSKVSVGRISPREVVQLAGSLSAVIPIKEECGKAEQPSLHHLGQQLNPCPDVISVIRRTLVDEPAQALGRGVVIREGVNEELDQLRSLSRDGKQYLLDLQQREIAATGIPSLKIAYNNVFGYYIEVTNTHKDKVPEEWIRKQTLVNAERYITQELKDYETKILGAEERIAVLEQRLYLELVGTIAEYIPTLLTDASLLARLDCLLGFTMVAAENHYCRPVVDDSLRLEINEGRHPVIEKELPPGEPYITNSVCLDNDGTQVMMITGPNMAGKSALLRSVALNVLLAQIGSFVAADSAHIGVVDKIFTRVGASDNISHGESTFMVEMNEAASILNNMSARSLILFDELGRGTSTYDGISIAWAIVEHIHENAKGGRPKTLFATHYHELNEMEKSFERVVNYNVSVKEIDGKVVFLRKLSRGGSEHSFGIHVAKLAGMPRSIVTRANEILKQLETNAAADVSHHKIPESSKSSSPDGVQLSFFQLDDPVLEQVRDEIIGLDINNLTPMAALNKLHDIRRIITGRD